jgi:hypothetical protein
MDQEREEAKEWCRKARGRRMRVRVRVRVRVRGTK